MSQRKTVEAMSEDHDLLKLTYRLTNDTRQIVFLLGAGLTMPVKDDGPGVPGTKGVISLMRERLYGIARERLDAVLVRKSQNPYQSAFECFSKFVSQDAIDQLIRDAVLRARSTASPKTHEDASPLEPARLEQSPKGWFLPLGIQALGTLLSDFGSRFANTVLTTNFDPLIELGILNAGGAYFRTALTGDGDLLSGVGTVPHIIHLHGYWYGAETLHTPEQLSRPRPLLEGSLRALLRDKTVVVLGYGGWADVFTHTLFRVIGEGQDCPEVIWAFHEDRANALKSKKTLIDALKPQIGLRVKLYFEINVHDLFFLLRHAVQESKPPQEHESDVFWDMAEHYVLFQLGDSDGLKYHEGAISIPGPLEGWQVHVESELHTNPEMVKALDPGPDGSIQFRTDVILTALRIRSTFIDHHPKNSPRASRYGIVGDFARTMFVANLPSWMKSKAEDHTTSDERKHPLETKKTKAPKMRRNRSK